jgi:lipopolysaccharide/colanic/teichoic acid biosynthesis glycosyltransferase
MDVILSAAALIVLLPILAVLSLAIWYDDGFPVLFRHTRVGRDGRRFELCKLRSMRSGQAGPEVTAAGDSRITRLGTFLRRYKLDEIPQFWNVLKGEMSLVGPRPEVPRYVSEADPVWRKVLEYRPGITDFATLLYRNEESMLAGKADPERFYRERILPSKLALNVEYLQKRSLLSDLKVIALTARYSLFPSEPDASAIRRIVLSQ